MIPEPVRFSDVFWCNVEGDPATTDNYVDTPEINKNVLLAYTMRIKETGK